MKLKGVLFVLLFFLVLTNVSAAIQNESGKVDQAYSCLFDLVDDEGCDSLNLEEQTFALLSAGQCKDEVLTNSRSEECWPSGDCEIKETAQALLALKRTTFDSEEKAHWLLNQTIAPSDLSWFLQIDTDGSSSCEISFSSSSYDVSFNEDKKITSNSGPCLSPSEGDYWLEIGSSCLDEEFEISCDKPFSTNLLYKEQDSSTIFVEDETSSADSGGTTNEKVEAFCFSKGSSCDYEGSLWAVYTLDSLGYSSEVMDALPYLMAHAEDHSDLMPESFLAYLTEFSEYTNEIFNSQNSEGYWPSTSAGDRFYNTAIALLSFQGENLNQKNDAKEWLLDEDVQGSNGCWENNVKSTALILYSIWPEDSPNTECYSDNQCPTGEDCVQGRCRAPGSSDSCEFDEECDSGFCTGGVCVECEQDSDCNQGQGEMCDLGECVDSGETLPGCEDEGFFCRGATVCDLDGGETMEGYSCPGSSAQCCSVSGESESCSAQDGLICESDETCDGESVDASGLDFDETCCIGTCEAEGSSETSGCEIAGYDCREYECFSGEESTSSYSCSENIEVCCMPSGGGGSSYLWIWILGILIVLVVLGIIFKDKLRLLWLKLKGGKGSGRPTGPRRPGFPPPTNRLPPRGPPRRVIPRHSPPPQRAPPRQQPKSSNKEMDDILKKLKDMGK